MQVVTILNFILKKRDYAKESFTEFYRRFLLPQIDKSFDYETYHAKSCGCEACQNLEATVHAFPNFKWSGKIGLGYSSLENSKNNNVESGWFVEGEIGLNLGQDEWKYSAKNDFSTESLFPSLQSPLKKLFGTLEDMTDDKRDDLKKLGVKNYQESKPSLVNFKFTPPNIALGGEVELKEVKDSNEVDLAGKIGLELKPPAKVEMSTDILDWLIVYGCGAAAGAASAGTASAAGTKFGHFLVRVKKWAADNGAVVQAVITVEGGIEAKLEWNKDPGSSWKSIGSGSEAQSSLTIGLKAEVSIEKTIWQLSAKAGAELYA